MKLLSDDQFLRDGCLINFLEKKRIEIIFSFRFMIFYNNLLFKTILTVNRDNLREVPIENI